MKEEKFDRLISPMKKNDNGKFSEISWSQAVSEIKDKLGSVISSFGAESIAVHIGSDVDSQTSEFYKRFCESLGTPNFSSYKSYSGYASELARKLVYGQSRPVLDFENSDTVVLWGASPDSFKLDSSALEGKKLVVVDPFKNSFAKESDLYVQIRPGSDGALALGILNSIIQSGDYDREFVDIFTKGFEDFREYVSAFSPERVEMITWVPSEDVVKLAEIYRSSSRVCTLTGKSLELQTNGIQTLRAIASLETILGNLDVDGGVKFVAKPELKSLSLGKDNSLKPIGCERFPVFCGFSGEAQSNLFASSILSGEPNSIKAMMVLGNDALSSWPNSSRTYQALQELDFLVAFDSSVTLTSSFADIVLPLSLPEERDELVEVLSGDKSKLLFSPKLSSDGPSLNELEFLLKLAKEMGLSSDFPWSSGIEALDYRLSALDLDCNKLSAMPNGYCYGSWSEKSYISKGFDTPSGKVEFKSDILSSHGYDSIPAYMEVEESMLTNPPNSVHIFTTTFGNSELEEPITEDGLPVVFAHSAVFKKYHFHDRELVDISTDRGNFKAILHESEDICPNTLYIQNCPSYMALLSSDTSLDPISGYPGAKSLLVDISETVR
ncbi:acetylene hydratase [Andreesenia angusta]|uniref:Acetylene hydratase n=1 Tax=Andreesenia angusta TaxID=39480 RepID=A0A1S1VAZ5_9FIRM|nr:acetylene hydratase [Andreesenia angusta]